MKIAILDDYQNVAMEMADWSAIEGKASIVTFADHVVSERELINRLLPFDVVCVMRERTPLPANVIAQLPKLKLIASTGFRNASVDTAAASERGIEVLHTGYDASAAVELTWALILAGARYIVQENLSIRSGGWQRRIGEDLHGKTLGILGLGNIGARVAQIGQAFGMQIVAWSQNLTSEAAERHGAKRVSKEELFRQADILSVHLILSPRSRGLVGAAELALMKPTARLVNTSRGPIIDEAALVAVLQAGKIAGASLDVFDQEPLPQQHPFRGLTNVLATPHIGYVANDLYRIFYQDTVSNITQWLKRHAEVSGG